MPVSTPQHRKRWMRYFDAATVSRLAAIGFQPSGLVEGNLVGNHRSPFHGFAIEFAGHRGYVPGDDIKHMDWTAYYKTGKYLLKQYEQETNFIAHIVMDVSESMDLNTNTGKNAIMPLTSPLRLLKSLWPSLTKWGFIFLPKVLWTKFR